jgi:hypothetical protein
VPLHANAAAPAAQPPAPTSCPPGTGTEGGWGQTGGGSRLGLAQLQLRLYSQLQLDLPPAGGGWGQPTASRQGMPAMQAPTSFPLAAPPAAAPDAAAAGSPAASEAWGRSGQASSSGWATQGSPWGDPCRSSSTASPCRLAQTAANPFSQASASQSFAQPTQPAQLPWNFCFRRPYGCPRARGRRLTSRALAWRSAADGALISPVKGRRRGAGTPAAFDWGSPDSSSSGNAGDPNQAGRLQTILATTRK